MPEMSAANEPACPRCGMTAQVEPSRSEPGRWMCHGCAATFAAPLDYARNPDGSYMTPEQSDEGWAVQ